MGNLKVAVPIIGGEHWGGGVTYLEYLAKSSSLLQENKKLDLFLIVRQHQLRDYAMHKSFLNYFAGVIFIGGHSDEVELTIGDSVIFCDSYDELAKMTDVYFPASSIALPNRCSVSWIPDFQHKYLSNFFSQEEIVHRDNKFKEIADQAKIVIFSSESAKNDFLKFYPESKAMTDVLRFYLLPNEKWYNSYSNEILDKYGIDSEYIICSNQFWIHKNHKLLFQSIKVLKDMGIEIKVVCTGGTIDNRNDKYFGNLMSYIEQNNLTQNIKILGFIPREEQIQLIRNSLFVVQPSHFEGWSTIVEDCRVLGKMILMSDIDVHIEQAPRYGYYFKQNDPDHLASQIRLLIDQKVDPEQQRKREREAKDDAYKNVERYAETLYSILTSAVVNFNN
ncbi:glycosyltransferase [Paenibacillus oryzisoli]|uniref:Glycosyl transferase family 1 domain-containing protein n=1 Tax=Paenibacillus oryzisoli TaxID=1850517 RepID=A0A198A011_9BACL|nr:glycosyltransferase [Paenibacillus oryzisoli]OAS14510.1 hypothetical protein A8708_33975 [Paenibacillus oryzisoli]